MIKNKSTINGLVLWGKINNPKLSIWGERLKINIKVYYLTKLFLFKQKYIILIKQRNGTLAPSSHFLIPVSLHPNGANLGRTEDLF